MKENSKLHRFENWLSNTFWYHYKWYYMAALFAVSLILCIAISTLTRVHSDWTVVYAHSGTANPKAVAALDELLAQRLPDTTGNGKLDLTFSEIALADGQSDLRDERGLYYAANDEDIYLILLDEETYALYHSELGFFEEAVYDAQLGLYILLNDYPPKLHTNAEEDYAKFTEEELREVNDEITNQHNARVEEIRALLANWGQTA